MRKLTELPRKPDLCHRCKNVKVVKKIYKDDPDNGYGVQGRCDRCEGWFRDLWSLVRKSALDRMADV